MTSLSKELLDVHMSHVAGQFMTHPVYQMQGEGSARVYVVELVEFLW